MCERCETMPTAQYEAAQRIALERAETLGKEHGYNAATWYFDGNTSRERYVEVVKGIDDGDPMVTGDFPEPRLSGEWADDYSSQDLFRDACQSAGLCHDHPGVSDNIYNQVCDAYSDAFREACETEIERAARYQVED